jgi:hypothetical protein
VFVSLAPTQAVFGGRFAALASLHDLHSSSAFDPTATASSSSSSSWHDPHAARAHVQSVGRMHTTQFAREFQTALDFFNTGSSSQSASASAPSLLPPSDHQPGVHFFCAVLPHVRSAASLRLVTDAMRRADKRRKANASPSSPPPSANSPSAPPVSLSLSRSAAVNAHLAAAFLRARQFDGVNAVIARVAQVWSIDSG